MWRSKRITIGLHQGSSLSPFLYVTALDEITQSIQRHMSWYMFAEDIILVNVTRKGANAKLE